MTPTDPAPEGWPHFSEIAHQPIEDSDYERGVCDGKRAAYYQLRSRRDRLVEALRAEIAAYEEWQVSGTLESYSHLGKAKAHRIAVQGGEGK